jgi:mannitol-1-phosphate 5-dehydrogenase
MKRAVHFGAGNIGRGFIAPTLQANNYQVTFIDVNTDVIKRINDEGSYTVKSLSIEGTTEQKVKDVNAVELNDTDTLNKILLDADIITTSVGPKFVKGVYEKIATLENQKDQIFVAFENMYRASSSASSEINSYNENLKIIDAVVDKIVPPQSTITLDVVVETYGSIILDETAELQPLDVSEIVSYRNYDNEFYKKLWLLNGLHLQLAYYGLANGDTYIDEVLSSKEGREFGESAIKSLAEAYNLMSNSNENLDKFSKTIINRFALPEIKDEVTRIARNPEIKFSKNERFEYPLRLLIDNNKNVDTFNEILNIIYSGNYLNVEGFNDFEKTVINKGKQYLYEEFWDLSDYSEIYIKNLGN